MCGKGQRVRGNQAEEDITKHLGALMRSAMPVNQELEIIKQKKKKTQGEAHLLKAGVKLNRYTCLRISAIFC